MNKPTEPSQDDSNSENATNGIQGQDSSVDQGDATTDSQNSGLLESLGRKLDEIPEIKTAEQAVLKAKEELEKALQRCREMQKESKQTVKNLRDKSVGQAIDDTLSYVRKHPIQGMFFAGLIGLLLGKWFKK